VISYRLETRYFDRKVYLCCDGWSRVNINQTSCNKPICSVKCRNGGNCTGPNECKCKPGFIGKYCTLDEDECNDASKNNCEQYCINMNGGFKCGCGKGYLLNPDKQTCADINECTRHNPPCGCKLDDGVCNATCTNKPGSYKCQCPKGYFLNSAEKCEDVNECFGNPNICDQTCINKPGTFQCGCAKGYRYNGSACADINECDVNNGGCSDKCHNLQGGFVCSCPDGFYLTNDTLTCKVIKPTMQHKIICESDGLVFLDCNSINEKLMIIDVMYGRLTTEYCQFNNYTQNVRCKADNPIQHMKTCNGKTSCVLFFDESVYGNPCPNVEKYMQITYDCTV